MTTGALTTIANAMSAVGAFAFTADLAHAAVALSVATATFGEVSGSATHGAVIAEIYDATPAPVHRTTRGWSSSCSSSSARVSPRMCRRERAKNVLSALSGRPWACLG